MCAFFSVYHLQKSHFFENENKFLFNNNELDLNIKEETENDNFFNQIEN